MRCNGSPVRSLSWSVTQMNAISVLLGRQKGVRLSDSQSASASASSFFSSPSVGLCAQRIPYTSSSYRKAAVLRLTEGPTVLSAGWSCTAGRVRLA